MPAKLVLHPPQRAARFLVLADGESLTIGRDPQCDVVLEDPCISKRHARLRWTGTGWVLEDLGSKNGSSCNGAPPGGGELAHGDWLSFGGLVARFECLAEGDVASMEADRLARLDTSVRMKRRLRADLEPLDLLLRFLESALEVIDGERGLVLVAGPDGRLRPEVAVGLTAGELEGDRWAGSVGAIERALAEGRSVVLSDAQRDPVLGRRESVVLQGLGALACVPLRQGGRLLGLVYVDSRRRASLNDLDIQILEALAEHVAMVIASLQLDRRIRELVRTAPAGSDADLMEALRTRLTGLADDPSSGRLGGHTTAQGLAPAPRPG
jgi:FHA domain-containing protein/GAF domain-containing protein